MKLTVVSPTYNEAENIRSLVERITTALETVEHEIIIADDNSEDRTWAIAEELSSKYPQLRVLRRTNNRGLSPAVIDGFSLANGELVACIDADLQHDPVAMIEMMAALAAGADIAIGSRYVRGVNVGEWSVGRQLASRMATKLAQILVGIKISDPMSGYFMLRKADFDGVAKDLNTGGFKILLELVAKLRPAVLKELPITFGKRFAGSSKMSGKIVFQYLHQLWRLSWIGRVLPVRFLKFGVVGTSGVVVNLTAMLIVINTLGWRNWRASALATAFAIVNNYILNNIWTFRDRARAGVDAFRGLFTFAAVSAVGLFVTVSIYTGLTRALGTLLDEPEPTAVLPTWVLLLCQSGAILFGMYFNYNLNKTVTWKKMKYADEDEPEV